MRFYKHIFINSSRLSQEARALLSPPLADDKTEAPTSWGLTQGGENLQKEWGKKFHLPHSVGLTLLPQRPPPPPENPPPAQTETERGPTAPEHPHLSPLPTLFFSVPQGLRFLLACLSVYHEGFCWSTCLVLTAVGKQWPLFPSTAKEQLAKER